MHLLYQKRPISVAYLEISFTKCLSRLTVQIYRAQQHELTTSCSVKTFPIRVNYKCNWLKPKMDRRRAPSSSHEPSPKLEAPPAVTDHSHLIYLKHSNIKENYTFLNCSIYKNIHSLTSTYSLHCCSPQFPSKFTVTGLFHLSTAFWLDLA